LILLEALVQEERGEGEHHFSEYVVLEVRNRAVADANGALPSPARPLGEDVLVEIVATIDAIERAKIERRVVSGDVQ
jgi:hypothetical protein